MDVDELMEQARGVRRNARTTRLAGTAGAGLRKRSCSALWATWATSRSSFRAKAGVRPRDDLDAALAHELADCLWSILTLADCYGVDLESAFTTTMKQLSEHLDALMGES